GLGRYVNRTTHSSESVNPGFSGRNSGPPQSRAIFRTRKLPCLARFMGIRVMACPAARFTVQMRLVAVDSDETQSGAGHALPEAPGEVLQKLRPSLLALARARLHSFHDAQDAVQETCLRVLRNLESYR